MYGGARQQYLCPYWGGRAAKSGMRGGRAAKTERWPRGGEQRALEGTSHAAFSLWSDPESRGQHQPNAPLWFDRCWRT
eukprot:5270405-Prymnesium_polylepis.1